MNAVMIGAQGSGKGTQAELLSQALQLVHLSSGDLFRKAFSEKTALGIKAQAFIERGELVPDEITVAMILSRLQTFAQAQGLLLDGFPRTIRQAQALDSGLQRAGREIDVAIYLKVPRDELLRRLAGRYICTAQQHVYHLQSRPPKVFGVCDIDGSPLYQRPDDRGEAVEKRLDIFFHETIHLLDYYGVQNKLIEVDGNQSIHNVQMALTEALQRHREMVKTYGVAASPTPFYTPPASPFGIAHS